VLEDGIMSEEAWMLFGPVLSSALRGKPCEAWYGVKLESAEPNLFDSVRRIARDDGITDELLENIAPRAAGDFIIIFQLHSHLPELSRRGTQDQRTLIAHGGGSGPERAPILPKRTPVEAGPMEISATLFSVLIHKTVAQIVMQYSGSSVRDAVAKFAQKLPSAIPDAVCTGWRGPSGIAPPTESAGRKLIKRDRARSPRQLSTPRRDLMSDVERDDQAVDRTNRFDIRAYATSCRASESSCTTAPDSGNCHK
jgi:hypothetical protein